ncbi:uracil phosphoribosyltransferase [Patescibacteria group bacterium]|nr:uracil phosphoribosyltransferase [Patescibacteria group bacterium]MBU1449006.1 uracil phosphoribosyltransferase [Patescibacteria group bacterium]MBU2612848.1 uracil phosphoribosyltransferase [Patescibacteria group bacterium]
MDERVHICNNPALQEKLTILRDKDTSDRKFSELVGEMSPLLAYEAMAGIPTEEVEVMTPLASAKGRRIGATIALVPVLRAALGMVEGIRRLMPNLRVYHLGMFRDEETLTPQWYLNKLPPVLSSDGIYFLLDPMLATGNTAVAALVELKERGAKRITYIGLIAAPEGVANVLKHFPDVHIFTAALDDRLNEKGYILPGLGDAGDRQYGT